MYNWNTDTSKLSKDPEKFIIWKLEQMINYGLQGEKNDSKELRKYWDKITIDPQKRKVLASWL